MCVVVMAVPTSPVVGTHRAATKCAQGGADDCADDCADDRAVGDSDCMADPATLLIVGDGPVTEALTAMTSILGWSVSVTSTVPTIGPDIDAVVITSHHEDVDGPAIRSALAAGTTLCRGDGLTAHPAAASGMAAGQRCHRERPGRRCMPPLVSTSAPTNPPRSRCPSWPRWWPRAPGGSTVTSGAVTPIADRDGPIHPELAPGEATCPGG